MVAGDRHGVDHKRARAAQFDDDVAFFMGMCAKINQVFSARAGGNSGAKPEVARCHVDTGRDEDGVVEMWLGNVVGDKARFGAFGKADQRQGCGRNDSAPGG